MKPEESKTYLVYSRINCSVVSTSVLFEETENKPKFITAQFIQKNALEFPLHIKVSKVTKARHCLREPKLVSLIFSCWFSLVQENPRGRQIA